MVNFDIKIGFREIAAIAISIPLVYDKMRKIRLKYDSKEKKGDRKAYDGVIFEDVFIDENGRTWRREK